MNARLSERPGRSTKKDDEKGAYGTRNNEDPLAGDGPFQKVARGKVHEEERDEEGHRSLIDEIEREEQSGKQDLEYEECDGCRSDPPQPAGGGIGFAGSLSMDIGHECGNEAREEHPRDECGKQGEKERCRIRTSAKPVIEESEHEEHENERKDLVRGLPVDEVKLLYKEDVPEEDAEHGGKEESSRRKKRKSEEDEEGNDDGARLRGGREEQEKGDDDEKPRREKSPGKCKRERADYRPPQGPEAFHEFIEHI